MLEGDNTSLAFYSLRALQARPDHALPRIAHQLQPDRFPALQRSLAVRYLQIVSGTGDPVWVPKLSQIMSDPRDYIRAEATRAMGAFNTPQAHEKMISALNDPWEDVRFEATRALGTHKVKDAVPALIAMIERRDAKMLRAIKALGEIGDPRALPVLYLMLDHDRASIRQHACTAIGDIGQPESLGYLLKVINDRDDFVRFYANRAVGRL